jgi:glycosyltransferase involved in cell wall biosynthesis
MSRKLNLYRFFPKSPWIVLVRRDGFFPPDSRTVQMVTIRLPVVGFEDKKHYLQATLSVIGYLAHAFLLPLKLHWNRQSIQLVHAHFILPQGLFGLILARLYRVPLVISVVGGDVNELMSNNLGFRVICRLILSRATVAIAVSRPLLRSLQRYGLTNTVYLPNSVDTSNIFPSGRRSGERRILFVGTMTNVKRPLLVLNAFERVTMKVGRARLTMVGDGPLLKQVQAEIRRKRLEGRVLLLPSTPPSEIIKLLTKATVFVLASESEGMNNTLLEAMATGTAIVASDNESNREVLQQGTNALLFRVDDEVDLGEKLTALLSDEKLRSRLSRAARKHCLEEFSASKLAPKLARIYEVAIAESTKREHGA